MPTHFEMPISSSSSSSLPSSKIFCDSHGRDGGWGGPSGRLASPRIERRGKWNSKWFKVWLDRIEVWRCRVLAKVCCVLAFIFNLSLCGVCGGIGFIGSDCSALPRKRRKIGVKYMLKETPIIIKRELVRLEYLRWKTAAHLTAQIMETSTLRPSYQRVRIEHIMV
jgi:hypothetical protein